MPGDMDFADVVWEFDIARGDESDAARRVLEWTDDATRVDLHRALWCVLLTRVETEDALRELLGRAVLGLSKDQAIRLCREFYSDALEGHQRVPWSVFGGNTFDSQELELLSPGCSVALGVVIRERYVIDCLIGAGSFGVVYEATDKISGGKVAVKCACGDSTDIRGQVAEQLLVEADCLGLAGGFGLPGYIDLIPLADGTNALVMELIQGRTLADVAANGTVTAEMACRWCAEIAEAVDVLHFCGIYHRDLKPGNIVVNEQGAACLLDLGLAFKDSEGLVPGSEIVGTLSYMAPEAIVLPGICLDHRADIWSLGAMLYELVVGRPAPPRASLNTALGDAIHRQAIDQIDDKVPPQIKAVLERCLIVDRDERYERALDFAQDLRCILGENTRSTNYDRDAISGWRLGVLSAMCIECAKNIKTILWAGKFLSIVAKCAPRKTVPASPAETDTHIERALEKASSLAGLLRSLAKPARILVGEAILPACAIEDKLLRACESTLDREKKGEWLMSQMPFILADLEMVVGTIESALRNVSERTAACFRLAIETRSPKDRGKLPEKPTELLNRASIAPQKWDSFRQTVERTSDYRNAWFKWCRAVERDLLFSLEDHLELGLFDPFRADGKTFESVSQIRQRNRVEPEPVSPNAAEL